MTLFKPTTIPPSTTQVQHLHGKLQRKSVNEYNVDCSFETQWYAILGTKYIISMPWICKHSMGTVVEPSELLEGFLLANILAWVLQPKNC